MKLELSKADVDAVVDYIYQHCRTSPNGRGYKVWQKMFDFQNDEPPPLFNVATSPNVTTAAHPTLFAEATA
jgi:hypothetical protein